MLVPERQRPTYDLESFKAEVKARRYRVTEVAAQDVARLGFDDGDIEDCIGALDEADFYKTMPSETIRGLMQDVYRPTYVGVHVYLKIQHQGQAWVISFKKDEGR